jgi:hypothetical protein
MPTCIHPGCSNFGNPKKQGYCNFHGNSMGIQETALPPIQCPYAHCHVDPIRGYCGPTVRVDGLELPTGFTIIVERVPVPGDCIVSRVQSNSGWNIWMANSYGRVASVNETNGTALIHFGCDSLINMSYSEGHFVVIE